MQGEVLVLIPSIPLQTLESITNINIDSPFLSTTDTLFLDEAVVGVENVSEKAVYPLQALRRAFYDNLSPHL